MNFNEEIRKAIQEEIRELETLAAIFELPEEERLSRIRMLHHDLNALIG